MNIRLWGYGLLFFVSALNADTISPDIETKVWHKKPLTIDLPIGRERMIHFDAPVKLGMDKDAAYTLPEKALRTLNANNTLYLQAHTPFPITRVMVLLSNGDFMPIDLLATENASTHPLRIVTQAQSIQTTQTTQPDIVDDIQLARFAVQQLYAPKRLLHQPKGIRRVPLNVPQTLPLYGNGQVIAMPLVSYASSQGYVTALLLRNLNNETLPLAYDSLKGRWKSAFYYPQTVLNVTGKYDDSTTLFLISEQPFHLAYEAM